MNVGFNQNLVVIFVFNNFNYFKIKSMETFDFDSLNVLNLYTS